MSLFRWGAECSLSEGGLHHRRTYPHDHLGFASILMFKQVNKVINSFIGQMFMECLVDVIVLGTEARQGVKQARSPVLMTCLPYGEAKK